MTNYLATIVARMNAARPGEVVHVDVLHDDWCFKLGGFGACSCTPDISFRPDDSRRRPELS